MIDSEKRLRDAISGPKPDRVPVAPLLYYFAAVHAGVSFAGLVGSPRKYREAIEQCWEDFGPWDVYYPLNAISREMMAVAMPMKSAYPGDELPEDEQVQFLEEELMKAEDYSWLLEAMSDGEKKELRRGLWGDMRGLLRGAARDAIEDGPLPAIRRAASKAPHPFRSAYGVPRDPLLELRGRAQLLQAVVRLLDDPEIDTDLFLRYLKFVLRIAGLAIDKPGRLEHWLDSLGAAREQLDFTRYDIEAWRGRGAAPLFGMGLEGPFDSFSMARSMMPFSTEDLFQRPDEIRRACEVAVHFFVAMGELGTSLTGVPRFIYACHRTSNDFISPKHFADLAFPSMRDITERLAARGITMVFHCDGWWDKNLDILAELPEGKCVFQFDGRTDMRLAREKLGPGHCIFGDVPAAMMAFSDEKDVSEYCAGLIRDIGADGRFILGAGCEIPPNAKPENVRALINAPLEA